jgi:hypothetical protein
MSTSIAPVIFTLGSDVQELLLAQFQLAQNIRQVLINANVPNEIFQFFGKWLNNALIAAEDQNVVNLLCK